MIDAVIIGCSGWDNSKCFITEKRLQNPYY